MILIERWDWESVRDFERVSGKSEGLCTCGRYLWTRESVRREREGETQGTTSDFQWETRLRKRRWECEKRGVLDLVVYLRNSNLRSAIFTTLL